MAEKKAVKKKAAKRKAAKKKVAKKPPRKKTKGSVRKGRADTQLRHARLTEMAISMVRTRMSEGITLAEGLTLASIAKAFRISRWHLSRIFAEQKGMPFSRFATRERMKVAKRLLRDVTLKTSEVGYQCGFKNPDYFSTWFRRHEKRSPTAYRAQILRK